MRYLYLNHIFADYFAIRGGVTADQGLATLRASMTENEVLAKGLRKDIRLALADDSIEWHMLLAEFEVALFDDPLEARGYARELLGKLL